MLLTKILIAFVALEHFAFLYLEMFLWTKPAGLKIFHQKKEDAESSRVFAANQGLYNGFLAAGLLWTLFCPESAGIATQKFLLICVVVAGIFGGATVKKSIFFIQALPALLALILVCTQG